MKRLRIELFIGILTMLAFGTVNSANLESVLRSATVAMQFEVEEAIGWQFQSSGDIIAILYWREHGSSLVVKDLTGHTLFVYKTSPNERNSLGFLKISDDASTITIAESDSLGTRTQKVFNRDGSLRFELSRGASLMPSPNGSFFCTAYDDVHFSPLEIYDSLGNTICEVEDVCSWNCEFTNNDEILLVYCDTARVLSISGCSWHDEFPLLSSPPLLGFVPQIRQSQYDSSIAIYSPHSLLICSENYNIIRRLNLTDDLRTVAFDDASPMVALQLGTPDGSAGYVRVLSTTDSSVDSQSGLISDLSMTVTYYFNTTWYSEGLISIWGPNTSGPGLVRKGAESWTLFIRTLPETGEISGTAKVRGLYKLLDSPSDTETYLRVDPNAPIELVTLDKSAWR